MPVAATSAPPADAVVVGAGHNGLVAANLLADAGWSVTVLEATSQPGGAVRSEELMEPGFVNDVCSAFFPMTSERSPVGRLRLEEHGLRWRHAPAVLAHPTLDGQCPVLWRDLERTAASLDEHHPGDGDAWRALYARWEQLQPALLDAIYSPFPPVRAGVGLLRHLLPPRDLARFARFALLPVRRLGEETFGGDAGRLLLAGSALHADLAPEAALSGFFGWLMTSLGQQRGFPVPEGGAGAVTVALVARLAARGGTVVCDAPVERVEVSGGRAVGVRIVGGGEVPARRAVLADVNAPLLLTRLVEAEHVPAAVLDDLARFDWDDATFKLDWNLDGPVPWTSEGARRAGTVHVAEGVDALTVMSSELARGLVPTAPFLLVGQQSMTDPTRQPAGAETLWAYTHVPYRPRGDAAGLLAGDWRADDVAAFADRVEDQVEALAPGFRDLVRGRHLMSPADFVAHNPNMRGAAINGGTSQIHQQLVFRPVPGSGRAATPVRDLWLAGSSAHPGGAVHGTPGANAARAALAAHRRRTVRTAFARGAGRVSPSVRGMGRG